MNAPLRRTFGQYDIVFRKSEHIEGRPSPHVEVWKGSRKIGNYDMASGEPLPGSKKVSTKVANSIREYLTDFQVRSKVMDAIKESFFDLSKPAGKYGAVPKGFKVVVSVEIDE